MLLRGRWASGVVWDVFKGASLYGEALVNQRTRDERFEGG